MFCSKCGFQLNTGANFCSNCGEGVKTTVSETVSTPRTVSYDEFYAKKSMERIKRFEPKARHFKNDCIGFGLVWRSTIIEILLKRLKVLKKYIVIGSFLFKFSNWILVLVSWKIYILNNLLELSKFERLMSILQKTV